MLQRTITVDCLWVEPVEFVYGDVRAVLARSDGTTSRLHVHGLWNHETLDFYLKPGRTYRITVEDLGETP